MVVEVACEYCGKLTEKWQSEIERSKKVFCSRDCSQKYQTKGKIKDEYYCDFCGNSIERSPSQIGRYAGGQFCSEDCSYKGRQDRSESVSIECAGCGDRFTIRKARLGFDNFCSDSCRERFSETCPECGEIGFKSMIGVKMHYTRTHGKRFDTARIEEKYGVSLDWLLPVLHLRLKKPIYKIADDLDVSRDWIKTRLNEMGDGHRSISHRFESNTELLAGGSDVKLNNKVISIVKNFLSEESWDSISKRIRHQADACSVCHDEKPIDELHVHHIIPVRYGGTNDEWNLLPVCSRCHIGVESYTFDVIESVL